MKIQGQPKLTDLQQYQLRQRREMVTKIHTQLQEKINADKRSD
ncbi:hypothetical protein [Calothrix sp. NIES-2098]|nr:hypothetical protein NIES2098_41930 [Calothrix sp. NIES-2098]